MQAAPSGKLVPVVLAALALAGCGDSVARVGPKPRAGGQVVVLLHGYGAPGDDLVSFAKELSQARPEVTFLVPEGPHLAGSSGRSWLGDVSAPSQTELSAKLDAEMKATLAGLWKVIDRARQKGVACKDITVGGFSEGGGVAAHLALSAPPECPLGGVIVLSGGVTRLLPLPSASAVPRMRVLVTHGKRDGVVGFESGQATARHFAVGGHDVSVLWFDGPHRIAPEVRAAVKGFMGGETVGEELR